MKSRVKIGKKINGVKRIKKLKAKKG